MKAYVLTEIHTHESSELSNITTLFLCKEKARDAFDVAYNEFIKSKTSAGNAEGWLKEAMQDEIISDHFICINYVDAYTGAEDYFELKEVDLNGPFLVCIVHDKKDALRGLGSVATTIHNDYASAQAYMQQEAQRYKEELLVEGVEESELAFEVDENVFYVNDGKDYYIGAIRTIGDGNIE